MNGKIIMLNTGAYEAQAEHSWLVSSGFPVFSSDKKSGFSDHIEKLAPEFIFINAVNSIQEGIETCIYLKSKHKNQSFSIIFYSEWPDDQTQIKILKAGPDECLVRTTNQDLFNEKIKKITGKSRQGIRSAQSQEAESKISIDRDQYCIYVNDIKYYLPRLQFNLLELLMSQPQKIFTYQEIENQVFAQSNKDKNIKVYISKIRKIIGSGYIRNIPEKGYIFQV